MTDSDSSETLGDIFTGFAAGMGGMVRDEDLRSSSAPSGSLDGCVAKDSVVAHCQHCGQGFEMPDEADFWYHYCPHCGERLVPHFGGHDV